MELRGRVAVITGGARGQGLAHAQALARDGASIALLDACDQIDSVPYGMATKDQLASAVESLRTITDQVHSAVVDMRDESMVMDAFKEIVDVFGRIDILVVNHGIWSRGALWELTGESWRDMIDTNLTGAWHALKAAAPTLIGQRSGSVILTSSVNGVEGQPGSAHYTASKHGVLGLMKSAAQEFAPYGVRVNAVLPGFVDSDMTNWQGCYDMTGGAEGSTRAEHVQNARHWPAIGGLIEPSEVSQAVLWLASDRSARVTGIELPIDGGHLILPGYNHEPAAQ